MTVLQAAAQAVAQLSIFDLTDFENNGTVKKFEHAESVIAGSFNSFGVRFVFLMFSVSENIEFLSQQLSEQWSQKANDRREAWKKDKARMDQLNKALNKVSRLVTNKQAKFLMTMRSPRAAVRPS